MMSNGASISPITAFISFLYLHIYIYILKKGFSEKSRAHMRFVLLFHKWKKKKRKQMMSCNVVQCFTSHSGKLMGHLLLFFHLFWFFLFFEKQFTKENKNLHTSHYDNSLFVERWLHQRRFKLKCKKKRLTFNHLFGQRHVHLVSSRNNNVEDKGR